MTMADVKIRIDTIQNNNKATFIEDDDLELSLSLRPSNGCCTSSLSQKRQLYESNVLEASSVVANGQILANSDAQAKRQQEAKANRDLKRQNSATFPKNEVLQEHVVERRLKAPKLGFQGAAPPWLVWNAGGLAPYQGQSCNFGSVIEGKDGAISSGCSSGVSDNYQSISGPGGNSSDAGSHSSHPHLQMSPRKRTISQLQPCSQQVDLDANSSNPGLSKPQWCGSYSNLPDLVSGSSLSSKSLEGATSFNTSNCKKSEARPNNDKPLSDKDTKTMSRSSSPKEAKGEIGKPPKPVGQTTQQKQMCPRMPCVSTTGNGPNGKTITGILYKYIEGVSIICACHGESFSPAGFVEHAGSVDMEFPLKHIKVYM